MKKVLAITGIRSEYFFSRPVFYAIHNHPEMELHLVVTGAHLSPIHNYSYKEIEKDGFSITKIDSLINTDSLKGRAKGLSVQLQSLVDIVERFSPDWILAIGDREESLTAAVCGAYMNIPVAHYCAGDRVVGNVDDMVRHAVSRLSHLMLTLSEDSKERLIKAGEQPWRVHNVGHAGLDRLKAYPTMSKDDLKKRLNAMHPKYSGVRPPKSDKLIVMLQHSISSEAETAKKQMTETFIGVSRATQAECFVIALSPNSDSGSAGINEVIEEQYNNNQPYFLPFKNLPDDLFCNLLHHADLLIGNSSMGIFEAPFVGLPVINVGNRQGGRLHANNITFVEPDSDKIKNAILKTLTTKLQPSYLFGEGNTANKIVKILLETPIDKNLLFKDLTF